MDTFFKDIVYGVRGLLKRPGFTAIAVVTLALGIGANTAIFSVVHGVLLRPLSFAEADRLMVLNEFNPQQGSALIELSYPNFIEIQKQNKSFEEIAAFNFTSFVLTSGGEPSRVSGMAISANLFKVLQAKVAEGRTFLPEEELPSANRTVIASYGFWQRHFSDQALAGQSIILDDQPYTVIGVMPSDFRFPDNKLELWVPFGPDTQQPFFQNRAVHTLIGLGRLRSGITEAQATNDLATIFSGIQQQHSAEDPGHEGKVTPLRERMVGNVKPALFVLLGAVSLVLLIACANVANLLLARTSARRKEIAIRVALGASRWRVLRQSLTESLLLSALGGLVGLMLAIWTVDSLVLRLPAEFPRASEIGVNGPVLGFTCAVSLLTGIVFGLAPALHAARANVNDVLKASGKKDFGHSRTRPILVVVEVALSLMLFVGAGLLIKSFWRLTSVNPGFESNNLLTMKVSLPDRKYEEPQQVVTFYRQLPERLSALPGVQAVSAVNRLPISGGDPRGELNIEARAFNPGEAPGVSYRRVLPNYFGAMGIPLIQGREFDERDAGGRPDVTIINQKLAQRYWPNNDAIGKRIKVGPSAEEPWLTIVGVVGNVSHTGLDAEPDLATYEPHAKRPWSTMILLVRTRADPLGLAPAVQSELKSAEKEILIEDVTTMTQRIHDSVAPQRLNLVLLVSFAIVALLLAAIGIYGVMAYNVTQRTQEIGIRLALGARPNDVVRMVVAQGMKLVLIGVGVGLLGTFAVTRVLSKLLYDVSTTDPLTFGGVTLVLACVALFACYLPARSATRVDPLVALRYE